MEVASAWALATANSASLPGVAAAVGIAALTTLAVFSGDKPEPLIQPTKERLAELVELRKNRVPSTTPMPNPTRFQVFMGGLAGSMMACVFMFTPLWLLVSIYLVVIHPMELWAWLFIAPVILSAALPTIASPRLFKFLFQCCPAYFRFESVVEQPHDEVRKLSDERSVIYSMVPHGVITYGAVCAAVTWSEWFFDPSKSPTAAATIVVRTPLLKHIAGLFGMTSASKDNLTKQLETGHCCIYIGGMAELFLSSPNEERLFLRQRKGFIKLALRTGSEIVPIYYFGNSSALKVCRHPIVRKFARITGISLTPMWGRWGLLIPRPVKMVSVLGKPLGLPKTPNPNPTSEEVDKYHAMYESEIKRIFDTYKDLSPEYALKELKFE